MTDTEKTRRENCETLVKELHRISGLPESSLYSIAGRILKRYDLTFALSVLAPIFGGHLSHQGLARLVFGALKNKDMKRIDVDIKVPYMGMEV